MAGTLYDKNTDFDNESAYLASKQKEAEETNNAGLADWVSTQQKNLQWTKDALNTLSAGNWIGTGLSKSGSGSATNLINSAYQSSLTAQERQLKSALEEALADLALEKTNVGTYYDSARSDAYADQMVANKNSNERMLAQGINSGAIAQSALSSNNALQGNLGGLSADEASKLSAIASNETKLKKAYQDDLISLQASLEAQKLNDLLTDYYNQRSYDYQLNRDAISDARYADAYSRNYQG